MSEQLTIEIEKILCDSCKEEEVENEGDKCESCKVNLHHLSYSTCKKINRNGVDYAVGTKVGLVKETYGKAADLGTMAHALVLGGEPQWVVQEYPDFRTKVAQQWRDAQTKMIIKESEFDEIVKIADSVKAHPLAAKLIEMCDLEQELRATINGIKFHGQADGINPERTVIFDLKTIGQFDSFKGKWYAINQDYDLQAAVYRLFGDNAKYYFIAVESVAPYRVEVFGTSDEFIEGGNVKLDEAITQFKRFRTRPGKNDLERVSFQLGELQDLNNVQELGDWS